MGGCTCRVHLQGANSRAASGLSYRKALVGTRWPILGIKGLRNELSHIPCRASISSVQGLFFSFNRLVFLKSLD